MFAPEDGPVPISFGYHSYLCLPGCDRADWEIEVPVRERLVLDHRMLPTGERSPVEVEGGRLGSRTFDDAYLAPEAGMPFVLAGGGLGGSSCGSAPTTGSSSSTRRATTT